MVSHTFTLLYFHIPRAIFGKLGGMNSLLICDLDINKIPLALSKFHSQILHFWKMIFSHNFTPHNSVLWNNRTILIKRKSVFKAEWFDKGILFVTDLMDYKGVLWITPALLTVLMLTVLTESIKTFVKLSLKP